MQVQRLASHFHTDAITPHKGPEIRVPPPSRSHPTSTKAPRIASHLNPGPVSLHPSPEIRALLPSRSHLNSIHVSRIVSKLLSSTMSHASRYQDMRFTSIQVTSQLHHPGLDIHLSPPNRLCPRSIQAPRTALLLHQISMAPSSKS